MMLRAHSHTAVAIITRSAPPNPTLAAKVRAAIRASTMSASQTMGITRPSGLSSFRLILQQPQSFFQVENCWYLPQVQPKLDHCESDLRLYPNDHRPGSVKPRHL